MCVVVAVIKRFLFCVISVVMKFISLNEFLINFAWNFGWDGEREFRKWNAGGEMTKSVYANKFRLINLKIVFRHGQFWMHWIRVIEGGGVEVGREEEERMEKQEEEKEKEEEEEVEKRGRRREKKKKRYAGNVTFRQEKVRKMYKTLRRRILNKFQQNLDCLGI